LHGSDTRAYASAVEADELCDEEIGSKEEDEEDEEDMGTSPHGDPPLDPETYLEQKMKRKKYRELYKRQVKIETEAWQQAATEYKDLMTEMCRKSLAPNLPFAQSLLLSWFEPLRFVSFANSVTLQISCFLLVVKGWL
jgi:DNA-directed RNA polymerase